MPPFSRRFRLALMFLTRLPVPIDPAPLRATMAWPPEDCGPGDRYGVRLSIGLEDAGDLIADIEQALVVSA